MDLHKPKPWHGAREFLKEYLIIVIGVLTALAGEQIVETVHRHEEVEQARAALKQEVRHDLTNAALSSREDRCLGRALLLWEAYAEGGPKPPPPRGAYSGFQSTVWDTVKTGAVANMPLDERLAFTSFYGGVANLLPFIQEERNFSRRLAGYRRLAKLSPQEADDLLRELPGMEGLLRSKVRNYADMIETGRRLGEKPDAETGTLRTAAIDKVCALAATVKAPEEAQN